MALSPSWQADGCSASQEFPEFYEIWKLIPTARRIRRSSVSGTRWIKSTSNLFLWIDLNIIIKWKPRPSKWPVVFCFSYKNFVFNSLFYKSVNYGPPHILRQRATSVFVSWLACGKWFTQPPKLFRNFYTICTIYKCGHGLDNTIWRVASCKL